MRYALTQLSEDEVQFRDAVRAFAENEIKPLVHEMDNKAEMNPGLVKKLFEMGLMGIGPFTDDPAISRSAFASLRRLRDRLQDASGTPLASSLV